MAFDTRNPANLHGIDVTAGNTDGRVINMVHFLIGAEIFVSLRNTGTIRAFRGNTGAIITTIHPSQLYPLSYARNINFAVGFANAMDEFNGDGRLIVVGGDGPFLQVPIVFPGAPQSPAGLNGHFPAA
jgi:hypothetical protein